ARRRVLPAAGNGQRPLPDAWRPQHPPAPPRGPRALPHHPVRAWLPHPRPHPPPFPPRPRRPPPARPPRPPPPPPPRWAWGPSLGFDFRACRGGPAWPPASADDNVQAGRPHGGVPTEGIVHHRWACGPSLRFSEARRRRGAESASPTEPSALIFHLCVS